MKARRLPAPAARRPLSGSPSRVRRKNRVLTSVNAPGGNRCADIFLRPDGSFGFEEFRRDPEDNRGWFPVGRFAGRVFHSEAAALRAARNEIAWLSAALDGG